MIERCAYCYQPRPLAELLIVREAAGLHRSKFVCRPSVDPRCFGSIGPRVRETIDLAVPEPPLLPRPRVEPATPEPPPVERGRAPVELAT